MCVVKAEGFGLARGTFAPTVLAGKGVQSLANGSPNDFLRHMFRKVYKSMVRLLPFLRSVTCQLRESGVNLQVPSFSRAFHRVDSSCVDLGGLLWFIIAAPFVNHPLTPPCGQTRHTGAQTLLTAFPGAYIINNEVACLA